MCSAASGFCFVSGGVYWGGERGGGKDRQRGLCCIAFAQMQRHRDRREREATHAQEGNLGKEWMGLSGSASMQ